MVSIEQRLKELGVELPVAAKPAANYMPYVVRKKQVTISGQVPFVNGSLDGQKGKLGDNCDIEKGQAIARICGINILAQLKAACCGDLEKVQHCVRLGVFVNATDDFEQHPTVANGVSDFMVEVLGEKGEHARFAVGVSSLPFGVAVEVDAIFEIA